MQSPHSFVQHCLLHPANMPALLRFFRISLLLWVGLTAIATHAQTLRVLAWPGYADADLVRAFEQRTGLKVEVTTIDSDEQLWARMTANGGRDFDVFAVNTAELQRYLARGLAGAIDLSRLKNLEQLQPRFRHLANIPGLVHGGHTFAIPYAYAEMGLIYDPQQWPTPPESIHALWDPRVRGRVLMYNGGSHGFSLAALHMGKRSPFRLAPEEWAPAVDALIALRRNVRTYYTQPEESVKQFIRHKAALMFANYGQQQVQLLRKAGVEVGYVLPREGALAWLDCWAVSTPSRDKPMVEAWLDFMLEKAPGQALIDRQGLASASMSKTSDHDRLLWLEPVEDAERRSRMWQRIVGGAGVSKVLAP